MDLGFVSGLLSTHKKALLQWLLHLHTKFHPVPSCSAVYPVDVTDLQPFLCKISMITPWILIGFQPKLVRRCTLISPWCIPSFSLIEIFFSQVVVENANCLKWRKKIKKLFQNCSLISQDWLSNLLQILYVDSPNSEASLEQIWLYSGKWSQSYIGVKIVFFVILTV